MNRNDLIQAAAIRIMDGDDSMAAASALESAILTDRPYDEELDDLLEILASYSPGSGRPYFNRDDLRAAIRRSGILDET